MTTALRFEIVPSEIRDHQSLRIQQGQVHVGPEAQQTYLRSCVCVGFYHAGRRVGALSHITGFSAVGGHDARGALREIEDGLAQHGLRLATCECFLIGGTDSARHVYDDTVQELHRRHLRFRELDVLGAYHRKLQLDPADATLRLYRKADAEESRAPAFSADPSLQCFQDRRRRVITGASLFFRNEALLQSLRNTVLPAVLSSSSRCHIWCAGCSTGMEVYSLAMVAMACLARSGRPGFDLRLLGTDISDDALAEARRGEYALTERARDGYSHLFREYCERVDNRTIRIGPELRSRVCFTQRDIREGSRHHRFDFVVCDHVLQYFALEVQLEFLAGLRSGVQPGGFLFASSPNHGVQQALLASAEYELLERGLFRRHPQAGELHR